MQKKLNSLLIVIVLAVSVQAQLKPDEPRTLSPEQQAARARLFFKVLGSLKDLEFDISKISKADRDTLGLTEKWKFTVKNFEVASYMLYPVVTSQTFFTGKVYLIKKNGKPFLCNAGYSISLQENWSAFTCDMAFLSLLQKKKYCAG